MKAELVEQLKALDPASRRQFILAKLDKLAPVKAPLIKWRYETLSGASPDHRRGYMNGANHTGTVSTCKACWEWRLANYG